MTQQNFPGRYILAADITLISPLHISAVTKGRYVYDGGRPRIVRYDAGATSPGMQCALTHSRRLMVDGNVDQADANGGAEDNTQATASSTDIPVIPASTLGGRLRNNAGSLIVESLKARGLTISTDAFNTLFSGSASTEITAGDATPEVIRVARRDPFLANHGGTSFMLSAKSVTAEGWPLIQATRDFLMSPELLQAEDLPALKWMGQMCSAVAVVRKDPVLEMRSQQLEEVVKLEDLIAYAQTKGEEAAAAKMSKAKSREAKESGEYVEAGKKRDLRTLSAFEAVNTGMSFALRVRVDATTPAQLGLMVLALQKLLRDGQIGGKAARGCGQFLCRDSRLIKVDPKTNRPTDPMGERLFLSRGEGYDVAGLADDEDSVLVKGVLAATDYLQDVSPMLLEAFASADAATIKKIYKGGVVEAVA